MPAIELDGTATVKGTVTAPADTPSHMLLLIYFACYCTGTATDTETVTATAARPSNMLMIHIQYLLLHWYSHR